MEKIIEEAKKYARRYMSNKDDSHDWQHLTRVHDLALHIAEKDQIPRDMDVLRIGALFHDIVDHKYSLPKKKIAYGSCTIIKTQNAKDVVDEFFESYPEFTAQQKEKVLDIVLNTSWSSNKLETNMKFQTNLKLFVTPTDWMHWEQWGWQDAFYTEPTRGTNYSTKIYCQKFFQTSKRRA